MPRDAGGGRGPQRRVHRGGGRPTDGRLPPKKSARVRVKYRPSDDGSAGDEDAARSACDDVGRAAAEDAEEEEAEEVAAEEDGETDDPLLLELDHLRARVRNVRSAIETCRGLADPAIWRENCLAPTSNAAREWRAIISHHLPGGLDGCPPGAEEVLRDAARGVFELVQAAMQSGPLVGSNPGYFKRCGAGVAGAACGFLDGIVGLTVPPAAADADLEGDGPSRSPEGERERTVEGLQTALLFTERQAERLEQWRRNARNAVAKGKPPSKSASRLQGQKSKKQRAKDLKRERRSGGGGPGG